MVDEFENMDSEEKIKRLEELRNKREEEIKSIEESIKRAERDKESEESLKRRITESSPKSEEDELAEIVEEVSEGKQEEDEQNPAKFYQEISSRTQQLYREAKELASPETGLDYNAKKDLYSIEQEAEAIRQYGIKNEDVEESLSALDEMIKKIRDNMF
jgi:hypothetical protein